MPGEGLLFASDSAFSGQSAPIPVFTTFKIKVSNNESV